MSKRKPRRRWRQWNSGPFGPSTYRLYCAEEHLATAQREKDGSWFWYGQGINTSRFPTTLEGVKNQVKVFFDTGKTPHPPHGAA